MISSREALNDPHLPQLQVMVADVCEPSRFLGLLHDFIVFEDGKTVLIKTWRVITNFMRFVQP